MKKKKIYPRGFNRGTSSIPHGFFYRLFSNQRFLGIIGLVFLVLIIFPIFKTYSQHRLMTKEINNAQKQVNHYESQNKKLEGLITYLHSDQSLEAQARLNLNMKKAGEGVIVINNKNLDSNPLLTPSQTKRESNLVKWWEYFFN